MAVLHFMCVKKKKEIAQHFTHCSEIVNFGNSGKGMNTLLKKHHYVRHLIVHTKTVKILFFYVDWPEMIIC